MFNTLVYIIIALECRFISQYFRFLDFIVP